MTPETPEDAKAPKDGGRRTFGSGSESPFENSDKPTPPDLFRLWSIGREGRFPRHGPSIFLAPGPEIPSGAFRRAVSNSFLAPAARDRAASPAPASLPPRRGRNGAAPVRPSPGPGRAPLSGSAPRRPPLCRRSPPQATLSPRPRRFSGVRRQPALATRTGRPRPGSSLTQARARPSLGVALPDLGRAGRFSPDPVDAAPRRRRAAGRQARPGHPPSGRLARPCRLR